MTRLEAIKARLAAATAGKWEWDGKSDIHSWTAGFIDGVSNVCEGSGLTASYGVQNKDNADFITEAHNVDVPWFLARVKELADATRALMAACSIEGLHTVKAEAALAALDEPQLEDA